MLPMVLLKSAKLDEAAANINEMAKKQVEAEKSIPTYKEMRAARIHTGMGEKERWAYRSNAVQKGYVAGTVGGGVLGGVAGTALGALLQKTKFGKSMPGATHALRDWVLPATIGYTGYRAGAIKGRKAGEAIARRKLNESGNPIPYVNPISLSDRGAADPVFMGSMMGAKTLQAVASEKSRDMVKRQILGTKPNTTRLRDMVKQDFSTIGNKLRSLKMPTFIKR